MNIKLDENMPARVAAFLRSRGHDVETVLDENMGGCADAEVWAAARSENPLLITQDLDFSDRRLFIPGSHPGLLLIRLRYPGLSALMSRIGAIENMLNGLSGCFAVLTESKLRVRRPD